MCISSSRSSSCLRSSALRQQVTTLTTANGSSTTERVGRCEVTRFTTRTAGVSFLIGHTDCPFTTRTAGVSFLIGHTDCPFTTRTAGVSFLIGHTDCPFRGVYCSVCCSLASAVTVVIGLLLQDVLQRLPQSLDPRLHYYLKTGGKGKRGRVCVERGRDGERRRKRISG